MAFLNIGEKDNNTPFTVNEFNYLINKLNNRKLNDLIDVQFTDPQDNNIIKHNGSGWVFYNLSNDYYNKTEIDNLLIDISSNAGGDSGVTIHNQLLGLSSDDHTQYHTDSRALAWLNTLFGTAAGTVSEGNHTHTQYALTDHSHNEYSLTNHLHTGVYSPVAHDHAGQYSEDGHIHDDRYFTETESDLRFAAIIHTHDDRYFTETESDARFAAIGHNHTGVYAPVSHNHDTLYYTKALSDARFAAIEHGHTEYSLTTHLHTGVYAAFAHDHVGQYAEEGHTHDDRYFTETESDLRFSAIAHVHDDRYFTETESDARYYTKAISDGKYLLDTTDTFTGTLSIINGNLNLESDRRLNLDADGDGFAFITCDFSDFYGYGDNSTIITAAGASVAFINGEDDTKLNMYAAKLSLNTNSSAYTLDVSGTARFTGNVTAPKFFESSDARIKTNIEPISKSFSSFELKEELGIKRYGVIAQEIEINNPELVSTDEKGMKSVNYTDLLVMKLADAENRIEKLEAIIQKLI